MDTCTCKGPLTPNERKSNAKKVRQKNDKQQRKCFGIKIKIIRSYFSIYIFYSKLVGFFVVANFVTLQYFSNWHSVKQCVEQCYNNKAFQSNADCPLANNRGYTVNTFEHVWGKGADWVEEGVPNEHV